MTKGGSVSKSKYARLEAVIRAEPTHIETQKNRGRKSAKKRGTSSKTDEPDKRFRASDVLSAVRCYPKGDTVGGRLP